MADSNLTSYPNRIFFSGVPGSRWSGIAQDLKTLEGFNTSDRAPHRVYKHGKFGGHIDAYFGTGMEFSCDLSEDNLDAPFSNLEGCKVLLSHEWVYKLDEIKERFPNDWILLVYRDNWESFLWWKKAGGWDITYPNYDWYENDYWMRARIEEQNNLILDFAQRHDLIWKQNSKHKDVFETTCLNYY